MDSISSGAHAFMQRDTWFRRSTVRSVPETETEDSYGKRLGAVITELRIARGMPTQQDLADRIRRHVSTIQRWETNTTMPNAWNIRELADGLAVDASVLLYPPDQLTPDILAVSRATAAAVRREMVKRTQRRQPKGDQAGGRPS